MYALTTRNQFKQATIDRMINSGLMGRSTNEPLSATCGQDIRKVLGMYDPSLKRKDLRRTDTWREFYYALESAKDGITRVEAQCHSEGLDLCDRGRFVIEDRSWEYKSPYTSGSYVFSYSIIVLALQPDYKLMMDDVLLELESLAIAEDDG